MTPEHFLKEECASVRRALDETLRYDYGPDATRDYYHECKRRLDRIEKDVPKTKPSQIWAKRSELENLAGWISLIERSRLGEFSWPFAEGIRSIAKPLLVEKHPRGSLIEPIVHIIAEGEGYQIVYEGAADVPTPSAEKNFAIVAFPRPLRYHVLLHVIFGHELGHAAQDTKQAGLFLKANVGNILSSGGHLFDANALTLWAHDPRAPTEVKAALSLYQNDYGQPYLFEEAFRQRWQEELICDLFGLLIFGPGFAAAHQALLRSAHRTPYDFDLSFPSHPPYAVRHKMLARAMRLLCWDQPVTGSRHGSIHDAEQMCLDYVLEDSYLDWASFFDDQQLRTSILGIQTALSNYGDFGYRKPTGWALKQLVHRLVLRLPPIRAKLNSRGLPILKPTPMAQTLYAGWVYWLGQRLLVSGEAPDFLNTNRLVERALLQERAMALVLDPTRD